MSDPTDAFFCSEEAAPLDDLTLRYIAMAQPAFEDLRDAAAQFAGLMVLAGSGAKAATTDHPMVSVATERWRAARETIGALRPTPQSNHHHHHLVEATNRLGEMIASLSDTGSFASRLATPLPLLRCAWAELTRAAAALPGFRTLDFGQACCANHDRHRKASGRG